MTNPFNPFAHKSAAELADMWQVKALRFAKGKLQHVLLTAMQNEYTAVTPNSWLVLLNILLPGFQNDQPFLNGYAKIMQSGRVVCEVFYRGNRQLQVVFRTKDEFISEMRRLADRLKLNDVDRTAMFALLGKWIVADYRVGVHGEQIAS